MLPLYADDQSLFIHLYSFLRILKYNWSELFLGHQRRCRLFSKAQWAGCSMFPQNPCHETGLLYFEEIPLLPISLSPMNRSCPHYTTSSPPPHTHTQVWAGWVSFTQPPFYTTPSCQHSLKGWTTTILVFVGSSHYSAAVVLGCLTDNFSLSAAYHVDLGAHTVERTHLLPVYAEQPVISYRALLWAAVCLLRRNVWWNIMSFYLFGC